MTISVGRRGERSLPLERPRRQSEGGAYKSRMLAVVPEQGRVYGRLTDQKGSSCAVPSCSSLWVCLVRPPSLLQHRPPRSEPCRRPERPRYCPAPTPPIASPLRCRCP